METIASLIEQTNIYIKKSDFLNALVLIEKITALIPGVSESTVFLVQKAGEAIKVNNSESAREILNDILFELAYLQIREPKRKGYPNISPNKILSDLLEQQFDIDYFEINIEEYHEYVQSAQYSEKFPDYYPYNFAEKSLEHYIAAQILKLNERDTYIDVASQCSPVAVIYANLFGSKTYRQDLSFPAGLTGNQIGGDAANMPVPDEFATKMALHCSFEHFEGDSDIGFIHETGRVLEPGGSVCIVPLYLADEYSIVTDPVVAISQGVIFQDEATVCCVKGFNNRFGRFYDPATLKSRILSNLGNLTLKLFRITNASFDPSCYVQFAALLEKPVEQISLKSKEPSIPQPLDELFEARKKIAQLVCERDEYKTWVPPGHFYSPIPSMEAVRIKENKIFNIIPQQIPGIDLNIKVQMALFDKFKDYYKEQPFEAYKKSNVRYFFENPAYLY
ncbi:MAG: hypothetical protein FJ240_14200, partial [Nitrospira sp.]|nr:hypothetical protein [Nitrospira sp.]